MSNQIQKKFLAANSVDGSKLRFLNNENMRFRNAAGSADVNLIKLSASDQFLLQSSVAPASDSSLDLGSSSLRFSNMFALAVDAGASQLVLKGSSISANSLQIHNLAAGSVSGDAVTYGQVILKDGSNAFSANLAMGGFKITGLADGTAAQDAVTKSQMETADGLKVSKSGDTMSGNLAMGSNKVTGLADGTAAQDAVSKSQMETADGLKVSKAGDTMSGNLAMGSNKITGLANGTAATDAVNKGQLDAFVSGALWLNPISDPDLIDDSLSTPPGSPVVGNVYIAGASATGAWSGFDGYAFFWNGTSWVDLLGRAVIVGDRFGVSMESATSPAGGLAGQSDKIAQITTATPGSIAYTFTAPTAPQAVYVNEDNSSHFGHSYTYDGVSWIEFGGPGSTNAGIGLVWDGNTLNVNLGAGIAQLPSDEVGVDVHTSGGLMTTVDNSSSSTVTGSQLAVKLDGSTLSKSSSGLKVAALGITNSEVSASAAIAYSKLNLASSIVNADVASGAAIAYSKLNLASSIVNADVASGAAIAYSKLNLASSIVNADVAAAAAIDYSKLATLSTGLVLVSDGTGHVNTSSVTSATLGFLDATSSIQTQLDNKATKALDNLASTAVNADIIPAAANVRSLGSSALPWTFAYVNNVRANGNAAISFSGDTTSGSAVVLVANTTGLATGMDVAGAGIPSGTSISSISANVSITLSANATATASGVSLQSVYALTARSPDRTGSEPSGGFYQRSGNVVNGISGFVNLRTGNATGTGSTGDAVYGSGSVVSGISGNVQLSAGNFSSGGTRGKVGIFGSSVAIGGGQNSGKFHDLLGMQPGTGTFPSLSDSDNSLSVGRSGNRYANVFAVNVDAGASQLVLKGSSISANSTQIKSVADPTLDQDAATKKYVDDKVAGFDGSHQYAYTLTGTDITNQYVDLAHAINNNSLVAAMDRQMLMGGGVDFSLTLPGAVTRLTFAGDIATGGDLAAVAGDILYFVYSY